MVNERNFDVWVKNNYSSGHPSSRQGVAASAEAANAAFLYGSMALTSLSIIYVNAEAAPILTQPQRWEGMGVRGLPW